MSTDDVMWDNLRKLQATLAGVVDDDEEEVAAYWVTKPSTEIDSTELPTAAKGIYTKARAMGWETFAYTAEVHREPALLKNDGKTGQKGDVKTEAHEATYFQVIGVDRERKLGFDATWSRKSSDNKNLFAHALVLDPVGIPTELFAHYEYIRQDEEYNDGAQYLPKKKLLAKANDFKAWLDDWVAIYKTKER